MLHICSEILGEKFERSWEEIANVDNAYGKDCDITDFMLSNSMLYYLLNIESFQFICEK